MKPTLISATNISKSYRKGRQTIGVLNALSLTIERSEFLAVMGPSGSGKSTLLNLLGAIDRPDSGEITFQGQRIDNLGERKLSDWRATHVGFVFQFYNLIPILTAEQNVQVPLMLGSVGRSRRRERAAEALAMVGLQDRAKHLPSELSGGEQQRVAIARAIVASPPLLLCDEPTGDLDRAATDDIVDILAQLNKEHGKTIVLVTHDEAVARRARRHLYLEKARPIEAKAVA